MGQFESVAATVEGTAIRVRFDLDRPAVVGWQIVDPSTGVFLSEGEWREASEACTDLRVVLPEEEGAYRVQIAPVEERDRFILIDCIVTGAQSGETRVEMSPPRVTTQGALRWRRFLRGIPRA